MVRLLGLGPKKQPKNRRYAATPLTAENIRRDHPMYQYALEEYGETVAPGTSNDDGRREVTTLVRLPPSGLRGAPRQRGVGGAGAGLSSSSSTSNSSTAAAAIQTTQQQQQQQPPSIITSAAAAAAAPPDEEAVSVHTNPSNAATVASSTDHPGSSSSSSRRMPRRSSSNTTSTATQQQQAQQQAQQNDPSPPPFPPQHSLLPDATYEEVYGPAWTGGTIKYVYPTGYQSMRPRSCPWKLSMVVTIVFTWLSIFIVGHCSDQASSGGGGGGNQAAAAGDDDQYNNNDNDDDAAAANNNNNQYNNHNYYDDDLYYYIEMSWCGSRPLYLLWVTSMLITGISAAYASVIGYIKVRDFAVANSRSQPPGVVGEGKSDYYVRLQDDSFNNSNNNSHSSLNNSLNSNNTGSSTIVGNIYQSDGTPQFWGSQIYRPTQAAVAVTSR